MAAKQAGADRIIVTGTSQDARRLEVAKSLGRRRRDRRAERRIRSRACRRSPADAASTSSSTAQSAAARRRRCSASRPPSAAAARWSCRAKATRSSPTFPIGRLTRKGMTLKSARGHSYRAVELALQHARHASLPARPDHDAPVRAGEVDYAIKSVGGQGAPGAIHVSVMPWSAADAVVPTSQQLVDAIRMLTQRGAHRPQRPRQRAARRAARSTSTRAPPSRASLTAADIVAVDFDGALRRGRARSRRWSSRSTPRSTARGADVQRRDAHAPASGPRC